jgi:hypothetical protein
MAKKTWINHAGLTVPTVYVPEIDKKREKIVLEYVTKAKKLHAQLLTLKEDMLLNCDMFFDKMLVDGGVKQAGKGNYSLTSFDKKLKIEVNVQDRIEFDDQIQVAHAKIKEYLAEITKDTTNTDLLQIVNLAFQTSKGKMDVKRVLGLFELKITHPKWLSAMELIKNSINRNSSKRYVRVWEKDVNGEYEAIDLNFSSL